MDKSSIGISSENTIDDKRTLNALARWRELANTWRWYLDGDYQRCRSCNQAAYRVRDDSGHYYRLNAEDILTLKVAHLRQNHEDKGKEFI